MSIVPLWTGREVWALRTARRMSVREFAAHLGVSDRMISKWEAGGRHIRPRPLNQAALDTSLRLGVSEVADRFAGLTVSQNAASHPSTGPTVAEAGLAGNLIRHPLDGKLMMRLEAGPYGNRRPVWMPAFYIDVTPVSVREYERFHAALGPPRNLTRDIVWSGRPDEPDPASSEPALDVTESAANEYARWVGKALPTTDQLDRAVKGGLTAPLGLWEWCVTWHGPTRRRVGGASHGTFRCATSSSDLHSLLAI